MVLVKPELLDFHTKSLELNPIGFTRLSESFVMKVHLMCKTLVNV